MATATQVESTVYYCRMSKIYERYCFRLTKQKPGEKFESFLCRLRFQSAKCRFNDTEEQLIDQIVENCNSVELRQKILAAGDSINLTGIISAANALETVNPQLKDSAELKPETLDTIHINLSKDDENLNRLAVDTSTHENIPCGNESISLKLSDEPAITIPICNVKQEFVETSTSGSTCTLPKQSIEPIKTETPLQVFRSIEQYDTARQTTQPEGHAKKNKKKNLYKCNFCNYATTRRDNLLVHWRRRHRTLHCTLCDFTTIAVEELKKHKATHPREKIKMLGSTCGFVCSSAETLTMHSRRHTDENLYECSKCNYACTQRGDLTKHMILHTREKPFVCSVCGCRFGRRRNLVTHMRTHTGEKPYKCSNCDFTCAHEGNLTRHMRQHTGETPFKCSICNFACKQSCSLTAHMRRHSGEKPYQCSQCNYACRQKPNLVVHARTHTGEKPFKCSICHFECSQRCSLTKHMTRHTEVEPYRCSTCNFSCKRRANLVVHVRNHTGEKPFKCSVCEFASTESGSVKRHMRMHSGQNSSK